ncbi:MAG: hypothetical protein QW273_00445 [Candidatus Pacearchaeota archaeon]
MNLKKKRITALGEALLVVISIFAFCYLSSQIFSEVSFVSGVEGNLNGCCLETKEGAICQDIPFFQSELCKSNLFGTTCEYVDSCRIGCCYSKSTGNCAVRATKQKCSENGGEWFDSPFCEIPQCQLGCCIIGEQAKLTNSRECTLLAEKYKLTKRFEPPVEGSCEKFLNEEIKGACLYPSDDSSGKNKCTFTTKRNCNGKFVEGYLCTSLELNTSCNPTKRTTCVEGKDEVYFVDSCGNIANIYDSFRADDQTYWEKIIPKENSCSSPGKDCGNCDYSKGYTCSKYEKQIGEKPTYGDYVCKNLNCGERRHGESWCIYDVDPYDSPYPVGTRHFIAKCIEGKISIEGCADFMQEICVEKKNSFFNFSEAKCILNDWRSCLNANDASSFEEVRKKCNENPQCIMFNDLYGPDNLRRSDGSFFAGFDPSRINTDQGALEKLGKEYNKILAHCVPRFTPGFQFWSSLDTPVSNEKKISNINYGSSREETSAICSLGDFVCVSEIYRWCTLFGGCDPWQDNDRNWECNSNGVHSTIKTKDLPALLAALNERCRAIGSCGVSSNLQGNINRDSPGFSLKRVKVTKSGKVLQNYDVSSYVLSEGYLNSIKRETIPINNLKELTNFSENFVYSNYTPYSSKSFRPITPQSIGLRVDETPISDKVKSSAGLLGPLAIGAISYLGVALTPIPVTITELSSSTLGKEIVASTSYPKSITFSKALKGAAITIGATIVASFIGSFLGNMLVKNKDWSPAKKKLFVEFMSQVFALGGVFAGIAISHAVVGTPSIGSMFSSAFAGNLGGILSVAGIAIAVAMIIYTGFFKKYKEQEFFFLEFKCEGWNPPRNGNCEECNKDVRPCSEYRCRSLGSNCYYFLENGEPGYCASINETWSAQITPWLEILTEGNKYTQISSQGFRIEGVNDRKVDSWRSIIFGIITDKPSLCRIDNIRGKDFEDMRVQMITSIDSLTGKEDLTHHAIELNAFIKEISDGRLPLNQGVENSYYIKCRNFAGQTTDLDFVVRVEVKDEPDLTPPEIKFFFPEDNSYLAQGTNSSAVALYANEPVECRYSRDYDVQIGEGGYEQMPFNMSCSDEPLEGLWICYSVLDDLREGENKFYFRCKDQPHLEENETFSRNSNYASREYTLNVCNIGMSLEIEDKKEVFEENNLTLSVRTYSCTDNSTCYYKIKDIMNSFTQFFYTGGSLHKQPLFLEEGNYEIEIFCEDSAKNSNNETYSFKVDIDENPPVITRIFSFSDTLKIFTDEDAQCVISNNSSICTAPFNLSSQSFSKVHLFKINSLEDIYLKCIDKKQNLPQNSCSKLIKVLK